MESYRNKMNNNKLFIIDDRDNVATALSQLKKGSIIQLNNMENSQIVIKDSILEGHKIAIKIIEDKDNIIKYGISIGESTRKINIGEWVHLHNMKSNYDKRSSNLDLDTGIPKDIEY